MQLGQGVESDDVKTNPKGRMFENGIEKGNHNTNGHRLWMVKKKLVPQSVRKRNGGAVAEETKNLVKRHNKSQSICRI